MQAASLGFNLMPCVAGDDMPDRAVLQRLRQVECKCCENEKKVAALTEQLNKFKQCLECIDERVVGLCQCAQNMNAKVSELEGEVGGVDDTIRCIGEQVLRVVKALAEASGERSALAPSTSRNEDPDEKTVTIIGRPPATNPDARPVVKCRNP